MLNNLDIWMILLLGVAIMVVVIVLVIGTAIITRTKLTKINLEKLLSLEHSEKKYRSLIETVEDNILVVDKHHKVLFANSHFLNQWELDLSDIIGILMNNILNKKIIINKIKSVLDLGKSKRFDFNIKLSGKKCWYNTIVTPQFDENKQIVSALCVFRDFTKRRIMEDQLKELISTLKDQQKSLSRLSKELIRVQEDERKRISRDLHDVIGQRLTAVSLNLEAAKSGLFTEKELGKKIEDSSNLVQNTIKDVQEFSFSLRPMILDDLGLIPAMQIYAKNYNTRTGIKVNIKGDKFLEGINSDIKIVLYRVFQEGLTNVVKHAKAKNIFISFATESNGIKMFIIDDGIGIIKTRKRKRKNDGLGFLSMEERLNIIGGSIDINSDYKKGTKLIITTPYELNG